MSDPKRGTPRNVTQRNARQAIDHLRRTLAPAGLVAASSQRFAVVPLSRRDAFLVPLDSRAAARRSLSEYAAIAAAAEAGRSREVLGAAWVVRHPRAAVPATHRVARRRRDAARTSARGARRTGADVRDRAAAGRVVLHTGAAAVPARRHAGRRTPRSAGTTSRRAQVRAESDALAPGRRRVAAVAPRARAAARRPLAAPRTLRHRAAAAAGAAGTAARSCHPCSPLSEVAALDGPLVTTTLRSVGVVGTHARRGRGSRRAGARDSLDALGVSTREFGDVELSSDAGTATGSPGTWRSAPDGLYVWDWEYSRPDVPFGLDLLHFFFQDAFVLPASAAARGVRGRGDASRADGLRRLGIDAEDEQRVLRPPPPARGPAARRARGAARRRAGSGCPRPADLHIALHIPDVRRAIRAPVNSWRSTPPGGGGVPGGTTEFDAPPRHQRDRIPDSGHDQAIRRGRARRRAQPRRERRLRRRQLPAARGSSRRSSASTAPVSSSSRSRCSTSCRRSASSVRRPG